MKDPSETAITAQALAGGMTTLRASAVEKARQGQTTFEEAIRVTHSDHAGDGRLPHLRPARSRTGMIVCPWCTTQLAPRHLPALPATAGVGVEDLPLVPDRTRAPTRRRRRRHCRRPRWLPPRQLRPRSPPRWPRRRPRWTLRPTAARPRPRPGTGAGAGARPGRGRGEGPRPRRGAGQGPGPGGPRPARAAEEALRAAEAACRPGRPRRRGGPSSSSETRPRPPIPPQGGTETHHERPEVHFGGLPEGGRRVPSRATPVD